MGNYILHAIGIKKSFGTGGAATQVLKGVDVAVERGEFVAIEGESGSGKSTLLYALAGIDAPDEGRVEICGRDLYAMSDGELAAMRRREVSFVYQFDNLVPHLTAYENIALPLMLDGKKAGEYDSAVKEVCRYLGVDKRMNNLPRQLSGGEQQRVALARALVTSPALIFLDEPTGSLDKERGRQVMELLEKINKEKGVALVMVTHSAAHAAYASRIIGIEDGRIKT